jgi:hypothetical protein
MTPLPLEDSPYRLDDHGPVFVLGCPRSGTTFLSGCLGMLPGVEEFVGVLCPPRLCHLLATEDRADREEMLLAAVRDVFWNSFWRRRLARTERLLRLVRRGAAAWPGVVRPTLDGALFCYKEPFLCFAADKFARHFPNAKFVHIVRDGRDNADSLERAYPDALSDAVVRSDFLSLNKNSEIGRWATRDGVNLPWWLAPADEAGFGPMTRYERCVLMWREMTVRARAVRAVVPGRYHEVRYEELVRDPAGEGAAVAAFLGKRFDRPARRAFARAFGGSVGAARRNQDPELVRRADAIAGPLLRELGYIGE